MVRAISILAVVALAAVVAYEYSANGPKAMVLQIHPHLSITLDGEPLTIPSHRYGLLVTRYGRIIL